MGVCDFLPGWAPGCGPSPAPPASTPPRRPAIKSSPKPSPPAGRPAGTAVDVPEGPSWWSTFKGWFGAAPAPAHPAGAPKQTWGEWVASFFTGAGGVAGDTLWAILKPLVPLLLLILAVLLVSYGLAKRVLP